MRSLSFLLIIFSLQLFAQNPVLIKDIYPGGSSNPRNFIEFNGKTFFSAASGMQSGYPDSEVWVTDGTNIGTHKFIDINPNSGSWPDFYGTVNGKLIFAAKGSTGREVYFTDGTINGTGILLDANPGTSDSWPEFRAIAANQMLFTTEDSNHNKQLWVTDGSTAGTVRITNFHHGDFYSSLISPSGGIYFGFIDYATDRSDLFYSEGTLASTINLTASVIKYRNQMGASVPILFGNTVFFDFNDETHGAELWVTDGTVSGTNLFMDLLPGQANSLVSSFYLLGNKFLFSASDSLNYSGIRKIWVSDGTPGGTINLKKRITGSGVVLGNDFYFRGGEPGSSSYDELWKTDGTVSGTSLVKDFCAGEGILYGLSNLYVANGKLFFGSDDCTNSIEPWVSDGTTAGTFMLKDISPGTGITEIKGFISCGNKVYFPASKELNKFNLFETDGTVSGTKEVLPPNATNFIGTMSEYSSIRGCCYPEITVTNNMLLFGARFQNVVGMELYGIGSQVNGEEVVSKTGFKIFPNPLSGNSLSIEFSESERINLIELKDISGKLIQRTDVQNERFKSMTIDSQISKGMYLVSITTEIGTYTEKLIIE